MPSDSTRQGAGPSWPLRVGLGLCVSALVIVGFQLKDEHRSPAAEATTTSHTTTTTTTTTTTSASGTTTSAAPAKPKKRKTPPTQAGPSKTLPPPIVNMTAFKPPGAGCRFSTGAPSPSSSGGATTTSTSVSTTSPIGRCTVLEIGDSLGNDLGWGIARQLGHNHEVRLVQADKSSSGLLTPWFYDWPQKEKVLLAQYKPQLVIITFGANDDQNLRVNGHVRACAPKVMI